MKSTIVVGSSIAIRRPWQIPHVEDDYGLLKYHANRVFALSKVGRIDIIVERNQLGRSFILLLLIHTRYLDQQNYRHHYSLAHIS